MKKDCSMLFALAAVLFIGIGLLMQRCSHRKIHAPYPADFAAQFPPTVPSSTFAS